uniref:Uncharacterized protein n=1 Tax=Rhizophora mucronata TaxID=61149 RepID=A0A2P2QAY1_RHIMU
MRIQVETTSVVPKEKSLNIPNQSNILTKYIFSFLMDKHRKGATIIVSNANFQCEMHPKSLHDTIGLDLSLKKIPFGMHT